MDGQLPYDELEKQIGFSWAHIRDLFRKSTGYPLVRYVQMRKIKSSAIQLINTDKTILEIACEYGFTNPETYTRAFHKVTGMTPSEFRRRRPVVAKEELCTGVYGIGILPQKERRSDIVMEKNVYRNNESTILYGVPKAAYGTYGGSTPYPICLKACSEYLGEDLDYYFTMVSSGAAFRLTWNNTMWDLSNVDIYHTFEESNDVYRLAAEALGREFFFLGREKNTTKEEFMSFIKEHIDEGYPCIALGIIGPPEACIITGYRKNGEELLGWNFFQHDPEFSASVEFDESGYFVCNDWWENTDTQAVMCMGAVKGKSLSTEEIIANAVKALSGRIDTSYSKGLMAYDAWKKALKEEKDYAVGENYSLLFEKMLCQSDAMSCLKDGRSCAASYFKELAKNDRKYLLIGEQFSRVAQTIEEMQQLYGSDMDEMLKKLADPSVRNKTCELIELAARADKMALELLSDN
ncbi:MAG: helix-turn-helix transcriptional regulator [Lachnospiraceae bacterium]|nr:helix-turn-helix transcriptional regulator [Lachnospiraceae bacterium]